jgi:hemolysin III
VSDDARLAEQSLSLAPPAIDIPRPLMRGTLHLGAAVLAPFGLVLLLLLADKPSAYVGASLYATTLILLYSSSASYHLLPWQPSWRRVMKRVDHAMIFALIAGTYTPFCLIVLGVGWGITMLSVVWTLAGLGMLLKIIWPDAPRWLGVGLYLALGWIGLIPAYEVTQRLDAWAIGVLLLGGVFYTVGGIVYARRRPDPYPRVFGFHEVFHALVIAGTLVHFGLIAAYLM